MNNNAFEWYISLNHNSALLSYYNESSKFWMSRKGIFILWVMIELVMMVCGILMRSCKLCSRFALWKSGSSWLCAAKWDRVIRSSCHCTLVWHFRIWQTRMSPGLSGLVPPVAQQATVPDGQISSLRPRKPRPSVTWPASLIPSMTRLSVSQTSRCPAML